MGWVMMSERELNRVEVLAQVDDGRLSVDNAANMLDLTRRQIFRLLKRYRQDGAPAIRHKARGKSPNNLIHQAKRDYALTRILGRRLPLRCWRNIMASKSLARRFASGWLKMVSGFRASSAVGFTSRVYAGNVSAS